MSRRIALIGAGAMGGAIGARLLATGTQLVVFDLDPGPPATVVECCEVALIVRDVLEAVGRGEGPRDVFVSLGYAGWSAGQLEQEIAQNAWLTVAADPGVLFETPVEARLPAAMRLLGIDFSRLSDAVGHA